MTLREAQSSDSSGILEIATRTWEGWDYVPLFLDQWIKEGGLYVAEIDGRIVGITKTTELSPGELWFEAIRVRESERGRGLGLEIAKKQLEFALLSSPRSIRLSTADVNEASRNIIRSIGFREYVYFSYYENEEPVNILPMTTTEVRLVENIQDLERSWATISESEEYKASKGLLPHTWKFSEWTKNLFLSLARGMNVYTAGDANAVLVILASRYAPGGKEIAFLEGNEKTLATLSQLASEKVMNFSTGLSVMGFAASNRKCTILEHVGMKRHAEIEKVFVYDYPLP